MICMVARLTKRSKHFCSVVSHQNRPYHPSRPFASRPIPSLASTSNPASSRHICSHLIVSHPFTFAPSMHKRIISMPVPWLRVTAVYYAYALHVFKAPRRDETQVLESSFCPSDWSSFVKSLMYSPRVRPCQNTAPAPPKKMWLWT